MALPAAFNDQPITTTDTVDNSSSSWDALYCSHLWADSDLRKAVINAAYTDNRVVKYCYTCKGKIRKYEIKSSKQEFLPVTHSTPNGKVTIADENNILQPPLSTHPQGYETRSPDYLLPIVKDGNNIESERNIPTISRQLDSSFRQKYTSYEVRPHTSKLSRSRLRKSLKGIGCILSLALTDSPVKKRTQIQACSISVMIIAIIVISLILVNFTTPSLKDKENIVTSTIVVPTNIISNGTSSITNNKYNATLGRLMNTTAQMKARKAIFRNISPVSSTLSSELRNSENFHEDLKTSNLTVSLESSTNLPPTFCSCQTNEVCMLETTSGKGICRKPVDLDDPTGCGGLCALNTEACREIDKMTGVKYCMSLAAGSSCSEEEWQCRNSRCVPAEARCNGTSQCYDKSDEMNCDCDLSKNFRCGHSMSCLPNAKRCDRVVDCWDGFDEINCTAVCPNEDQFTCNTGQCIELALFCDGLADCADSSDEPQGCGGPCLTHEMHCANGRCIANARRCDGHDDCGDMSDEFFCSDRRNK